MTHFLPTMKRNSALMTRIMTNGAVEVVLTIIKAAGGSTIVINPT